MADQDKHIEKLKKSLALAASGSPHEATLVPHRARKLMDAHSITHSDIIMSDIDETISHYWPTGSLRPPRYTLSLINIIYEAFGVNSIIYPGTYPGVGFYGNRERAVLATYTWGVPAHQLKKARQQCISAQSKRIKTATRTSRDDQFAEGWMLIVISEVQSFALTDNERKLTQRWLEHKYPQTQTTGTRKPGRSRNGDTSRYAGFLEGQNVGLHHPVSGQGQQRLEVRWLRYQVKARSQRPTEYLPDTFLSAPFLRASGRGSQLMLLPDADRLENTCQVRGGITTLLLLPVVLVSVGGVFRMTAESVVCTLLWCYFIGWYATELHRRSGLYLRYSSAGYWISWSVIFLCWPVALPLYVDYIGGAGKGSNDDD